MIILELVFSVSYALFAFTSMVCVYHHLKLQNGNPIFRQANTVGAIVLGMIWPLVLLYAVLKFLIRGAEKRLYPLRGNDEKRK